MAVVSPLAALRYDAERVGDVGRVLAPPYDVITPEDQAALYERSPYNAIRLILPRETNRAEASARALRAWIDERVLVRDAEPALYLYSQAFTMPDGSARRRYGILCRVRLEDFASGIIRPHERTFPGPKADRLAILRATGTNLSPIFGLYARRGESVRALAGGADERAPLVDVDGHRLWRIADARTVARVAEALAGETILIADGHHRYETALAYRDERPDVDGRRFILFYLANMEDEGVVILPTHRLVRGPLPDGLESRLAESFTVAPVAAGAPRGAGVIDCVLPDRRLRLRARPAATARLASLAPVRRTLDVELLQRAILDPILGVGSDALAFTHEDGEAADAVREGRATAAFLLDPPTIGQVRDVCMAGELMPEKSTYFFPKLATGLVFSLVDPPSA